MNFANLNNSEVMELGSNAMDQERSMIMKTDSRLRESLVDNVLRSKREMSKTTGLTLEFKEHIRKLRIEKLDYQREFLKLAATLNRLINEEIKSGEEKEDMQVVLIKPTDCCYSEGF